MANDATKTVKTRATAKDLSPEREQAVRGGKVPVPSGPVPTPYPN